MERNHLSELFFFTGSSFPKTKPKHGFVTVARLGTLRFLFLPLYSKWWVEETSGRGFALLLFLYFLQLINLAVYSLANQSSEVKIIQALFDFFCIA